MRHNKVSEIQAATQLSQSYDKIALQREQLALDSRKLDETARHNKVEEGVSIARQVKDAVIGEQQIALGKAQLAQRIAHETAVDLETTRHNLATEAKNYAPQVTVTTGAVTQNTIQKGDGLNAEESSSVPSQAARQGGTVFQEGQHFYFKTEAGGFYVWTKKDPLGSFSNWVWEKVNPAEYTRRGLDDWRK